MKKIYDSVHGFIRFNELENRLINSGAFQRLLSIKQLGMTYQVYPGATHTRFEHSLGVMHLATYMFDHLFATYPLENKEYARQIVRFGALCHDLGHLPFSHVAEHALLGKEGHELWTLKIIQSPELAPIWENFPVSDIVKMAIGEKKLQELGLIDQYPFSPWDRMLSRLISGDFFGADRMDYLLRDAKYTGVAYGFFDYHQLIEMLRVENFEVAVEENGIESCEALLLARMFMHKRVYQYPSVKAYSYHLSRFMKNHCADTMLKSLEAYLSYTDHEVMADLRKSSDEDALCILDRSRRFKAVATKKEQKKIGLSFPVIRSCGTIVDASTLSDTVIPSESFDWTYVGK